MYLFSLTCAHAGITTHALAFYLRAIYVSYEICLKIIYHFYKMLRICIFLYFVMRNINFVY